MGQTSHKSSVMGIIFGVGIVLAFLIVIFMIGKDDVSKISESVTQSPGKVVYDKSCVACHEAGVLKAPKLGDKTDWENRIPKGEVVLLQNAINGFSAMPPRGGALLSNEDLKLAVQYMLDSLKVETVLTTGIMESPLIETKPVVKVPVANINNEQHAGKPIYNRVCMACHNSGLLNAPKLGNKTDWITRIEKGEAILLQNSINGFNTMPPRGGNFVNDEDMKLAVQYMLAEVGVGILSSEPIIKNIPSKSENVVTPKVETSKTMVQAPVANINTEQHAGKPVYDRVCMACHNNGLLNAPKLGDKTDWITRIEKGEDTLLQNSINGFNTMPPRGGNFVNDEDMKLAVQYMLAKVGVNSETVAKTAPSQVQQPVEIPKTKTIAKIPETPVSEVVSKPSISKSTQNLTASFPKQGKDVYDMTCKSCHIVGIAGAPKIAEKKDWEARLPKGEDVLIQSAINGLNIMPPKGGNNDLTNEEVKLAVQYMLEIVKK
ncbi:MAG: cytochrome c5 family protein [Candidatus Marithrix sp.]|nr:cytochrome c5 family protein [Candidatus Marithrix sp.]